MDFSLNPTDNNEIATTWSLFLLITKFMKCLYFWIFFFWFFYQILRLINNEFKIECEIKMNIIIANKSICYRRKCLLINQRRCLGSNLDQNHKIRIQPFLLFVYEFSLVTIICKIYWENVCYCDLSKIHDQLLDDFHKNMITNNNKRICNNLLRRVNFKDK